MRRTLFAALLLACGGTHANTDAPPGPGQAGAWITPCHLLEKSVGGTKLPAAESLLAATCLGAFQGIAAVNYIDPPYLPFCEQDGDRPIDYVRIFLRFMEGHPAFAQKQFGFAVLMALAQAHPKSECSNPGG